MKNWKALQAQILAIGLLPLLGQICLANTPGQTEIIIEGSHYAKLVNPFIGTGGEGDFYPEGNTFPGAALPWGMVSVSPHTNYTTPLKYGLGYPAAASGYNANENTIEGFGLTHLSGVGCPELGAPVVAINRKKLSPYRYSSRFKDERASAGFYAVNLEGMNADIAVTATQRTGAFRISLKGSDDGYVLIDAAKNLSWNSHEGYIHFLSDNTLTGWSQTGGFCTTDGKQKVFFAARISSSEDHGTWQWRGLHTSNKQTSSGKTGAWWKVDPKKETQLLIGVSYVSMENALRNMQQETDNQSFKEILSQAVSEWDKQLGKIKVVGDDAEHKAIFYTALYHSLLHPSLFSDVNGDYPAYGSGKTLNDPHQPHYSVFSMWDTHRNVHSLLSLVYPEQQQQMIYSLEDMTLTAGHPPQWELLGSEVNMMVGDPVLSILAEAHNKGFKFRQAEELFSTLYHAATANQDVGRRPGNASYRQHGYIPEATDGVWGSVSTTLEYSYHDWSLAQMANSLGKEDEYRELMKQSSAWGNLFDPSTFTFRPKHKNGSWLEDYEPEASNGERWIPGSGGPGFVEGSGYHYAYMLPHRIPELIKLHGGQERFIKNLSEVFSNNQFVLWNEPDMLYPYLFSYADDIAMTQKIIGDLRDTYFFNNHGGLPGNDDAGTLSAWYVFSALGFYPVNPVSGKYQLGLPLFDKITVELDNSFYPGKKLMIEKQQTAIPSAAFEGSPLPSNSIGHIELTAGGTLSIHH